MKTTTIGQLSLLMLIEDFELLKFKVLSANTDGVVLLFNKDRLDEFRRIQRQWEITSKFVLEETFYDLLVMSNVNNYLAIKTGKEPVNERVKLKGWFDFNREPHKNHSMKIVSKALYNYYVHNIDYTTTIFECENIYDFCKAVKSKKGSHFELVNVLSSERETEMASKTVRYYVSNKGRKLIKKLPPLQESVYENTLFDGVFSEERSFEIESKYLITYFNKFFHKVDFMDYNVNYDYYINEVEKITKPIIKNINVK